MKEEVKREDKPWTRRKYPKKTYLIKDCKICKEIAELKNRTTNSHTKNRQKILEVTSPEKIRLCAMLHHFSRVWLFATLWTAILGVLQSRILEWVVWSTPIRMARILDTESPDAGEGVKQQDSHSLLVRMQQGAGTLEHSLPASLKTKHSYHTV